MPERCNGSSAGRGLDSAETKAPLWEDCRIRPMIDTRALWREEKEAPDYDPPSRSRARSIPTDTDTIVYTEKGSAHCICPQTGEQRDLAFQDFDADRNTLNCRCPAAAYGLDCPGREPSHQRGGVHPDDARRIVRIKLDEHDRRIVMPTPHRSSPSWQRGYNRIDHSFGFEQHFIRGRAKMQTRVGLALAVMMAIALGHIKAGRPQRMRSLVQPSPATG